MPPRPVLAPLDECSAPCDGQLSAGCESKAMIIVVAAPARPVQAWLPDPADILFYIQPAIAAYISSQHTIKARIQAEKEKWHRPEW